MSERSGAESGDVSDDLVATQDPSLAALIVLGLVGNTAYAWPQPDVYTSSALVMLSPAVNLNNEAVVVTSVPVLSGVLRKAGLRLSLPNALSRVKAAPAGYITLSSAPRAIPHRRRSGRPMPSPAAI